MLEKIKAALGLTGALCILQRGSQRQTFTASVQTNTGRQEKYTLIGRRSGEYRLYTADPVGLGLLPRDVIFYKEREYAVTHIKRMQAFGKTAFLTAELESWVEDTP
ncbi:hypothetical protein U6B65_11015 [Oscillospiraceae bacterium MB08-C2-2]|nr:hypothetical protein U6B65_11015 [Oscillospiraceae bacterium MB08-C2-2]